MFNQDLNPYVSQIQNFRDIILAHPNVAHPDCIQFKDPNRALIVDIGCGAGNFLRDYAVKHTNYNFIGFEVRFKRLVKSARKFRKHNLDNIRLVQARAEEIDKWLKPSSVKEININFPDPWPKKRQQKHRLITPNYINLISNLLEKDGQMAIKTDHQDYFNHIKEMIQHNPSFELIEYTEDLYGSRYVDMNIPTEFEQLFKNEGVPVFYLRTAIRER